MRLDAAVKTSLTPRQFAEAIGVSESSVKRWVDDGHIAASRTAGGHRRIAIHEAVRYVRDHRSVVVRPEVLGLPDLAAVAGDDPSGGAADPTAVGARLFEYLRAGAVAHASGLIVSSYLDGRSVAEIVDGPLASAMSRIGEAWVASPSGIFWEHRATEIAIQALSRLRLLLEPPAEAPVAVGGAPSGDCYLLPSLAVAAVLEGEGLRATNLGPETPLEVLAASAEELDARLVWLSVSVAEDRDALRRGIEELLPALAARGALLVVGGSQSGTLGLARSEALYVGRSLGELEALVSGTRWAVR